jgi:hypothetical protein
MSYADLCTVENGGVEVAIEVSLEFDVATIVAARKK